VHPKYNFLLPLDVLKPVFRGKFVDGLKRAHRRKKLDFGGVTESLQEPKAFAAFLQTLHRNEWVVYAKHAFGGPTPVLRYLGRYTHRVAISNHRLAAFDGDNVTFRWKDYAHGNKQRLMTLHASEFLRRYVQHVLPLGFVRIRQFGFLANRLRSRSLTLIRRLLLIEPAPTQVPICSPAATWTCPRCGALMQIIQRLTAFELAFRNPIFDTS
jgi:hypothetical protein